MFAPVFAYSILIWGLIIMSLPEELHSDFYLSFEELYDENFAQVNRYFRYRVHSVWDADDLTALVFMKALEKFTSYRGRSSFRTWLFSIAHHAYVDYMRGLRELAVDESHFHQQAAPGSSPEEQTVFSEKVRELRWLLKELPPNYRDVVALRYLGELRFTQIAKILGKTGSAVRMIHHRALKTLRKKMDRAAGGENYERG